MGSLPLQTARCRAVRPESGRDSDSPAPTPPSPPSTDDGDEEEGFSAGRRVRGGKSHSEAFSCGSGVLGRVKSHSSCCLSVSEVWEIGVMGSVVGWTGRSGGGAASFPDIEEAWDCDCCCFTACSRDLIRSFWFRPG